MGMSERPGYATGGNDDAPSTRRRIDDLIRLIDDALEDWSTRDAKEPSDQVAVYLAHRLLAIEAEARADAIARIRERVEGLGAWNAYFYHRPSDTAMTELVPLADVLAILDDEAERGDG